MTDVVSNIEQMQFEEIRYRSSISENTLTKLGANLNALLDDPAYQIGDVQIVALTETQMALVRSDKWVFMDGQDITGTDLNTLTGMTIAPDMRGRWPNGSDGDTATGQELSLYLPGFSTMFYVLDTGSTVQEIYTNANYYIKVNN